MSKESLERREGSTASLNWAVILRMLRKRFWEELTSKELTPAAEGSSVVCEEVWRRIFLDCIFAHRLCLQQGSATRGGNSQQ